jgi:hypothetical protein
VDDGECFPPAVQAIQSCDLKDYANPFLCKEGAKFEALTEIIRTRLCPHIHTALQNVPPYDASWAQMSYDNFREQFRISVETQLTLPTLVLPVKP